MFDEGRRSFAFCPCYSRNVPEFQEEIRYFLKMFSRLFFLTKQSRALPLVMDRIGSRQRQVPPILSVIMEIWFSVYVPFGLAYALDHGYVKEDTIFLMGTQQG